MFFEAAYHSRKCAATRSAAAGVGDAVGVGVAVRVACLDQKFTLQFAQLLQHHEGDCPDEIQIETQVDLAWH